MKIFDSHSHPQDSHYDADRGEMLQRAFDAGVSMICVGTDLKMSQDAVNLAREHSTIWASVGLHPNDNLNEMYQQERYAELAQDERVVAIGEIGLDYYRTTEEEKKKFQRERFLQQLELAEHTKKPVIIHCREAHEDMLTILKEGKGRLVGGVIHSFTGTLAEAQAYVALGFAIGLNGIITFARQYDEVVQWLPLESLLLETDAPYLTPVPYRGKRNESSYIIEIAKKIAELKSITIEEVAVQTTKNAQRVFQLGE